MSKNRLMWTVLFVCVCAAIASADVRLPAIIGDGMVLQQKSSAALWGWADPGEKIDIKGSWMWFGQNTHADKDGKWSLKIRTSKAGGPHTITIKGKNEIVLKDIMLGEVWVCSGQSNMQCTMAGMKSEKIDADIAKADYPTIRLFTVTRNLSATPLDNVQGQWQACTPETIKEFSAVAFYFGQKLHSELNVPVGLVATSWGGTKAEAWTSKETLVKFNEFRETAEILGTQEAEKIAVQQHKAAAEQWEQKIAKLDKGIEQNWFNPELDDSDWSTMELPSAWTGTDLAEVDGIVWFRRNTSIPPSWARGDLELFLGTIDDNATVWFNGVKLGSTFGYDQKNVYLVPNSAIHVGKNIIAVRVVDTGSEGGFTGTAEDMRIAPPGADIKAASTVSRTWKYKISYQNGKLPVTPDSSPSLNSNTPSVLYNAMIAPLVPMRIAGAIWYQGESNSLHPMLYRTLFPAMITDWRDRWNQGLFPFYYVQIAPYAYNANIQSQALREAQMLSLDAIPHVGMAVTMDIGEEKNIHPVNKWDVGDRLARWALAKTYGKKNIVYSGPIYKSMKVQRDTVRISFDYVNGGLVAKGGPLTDFMIAGEDKNFIPAKAVIDGKDIVVSSSEVKNPVAVRYAWSNWASPNLFNAAGLPASSFRTDDWPLQ